MTWQRLWCFHWQRICVRGPPRTSSAKTDSIQLTPANFFRWPLRWAKSGIPSTSCASSATRRSAPRPSSSARASRTARRIITSFSRPLAPTAISPCLGWAAFLTFHVCFLPQCSFTSSSGGSRLHCGCAMSCNGIAVVLCPVWALRRGKAAELRNKCCSCCKFRVIKWASCPGLC